MADQQQLLDFLVILTLLVYLCLFGLWHVRSVTFRLIMAALAGFLTYFAVGAAISLVAPYSLVSSLYFRIFGLAPLIAHAFDPDYTGEEGLVFRIPWLGERINMLVVIAFWTLLSGILYFRFVSRTRRTI